MRTSKPKAYSRNPPVAAATAQVVERAALRCYSFNTNVTLRMTL